MLVLPWVDEKEACTDRGRQCQCQESKARQETWYLEHFVVRIFNRDRPFLQGVRRNCV